MEVSSGQCPNPLFPVSTKGPAWAQKFNVNLFKPVGFFFLKNKTVSGYLEKEDWIMEGERQPEAGCVATAAPVWFAGV